MELFDSKQALMLKSLVGGGGALLGPGEDNNHGDHEDNNNEARDDSSNVSPCELGLDLRGGTHRDAAEQSHTPRVGIERLRGLKISKFKQMYQTWHSPYGTPERVWQFIVQLTSVQRTLALNFDPSIFTTEP
jgi:hypothetical protein